MTGERKVVVRGFRDQDLVSMAALRVPQAETAPEITLTLGPILPESLGDGIPDVINDRCPGAVCSAADAAVTAEVPPDLPPETRTPPLDARPVPDTWASPDRGAGNDVDIKRDAALAADSAHDAPAAAIDTGPDAPLILITDNPLLGVGDPVRIPLTLDANPDFLFTAAHGPVWLEATASLILSDWKAHLMYRFVPPAALTVFRSDAKTPVGNSVDPEGRLISCDPGKSEVTRTVAGVVSQIKGGLMGPTDLVARSDGTIYFTDFPGAQVFRISGKGVLASVSTALVLPNGIALSPDEHTLYVGDKAGKAGIVKKFAVMPDGSTGPAVDFANTLDTHNAQGKPLGVAEPEGITVDDAGNVYVAGGTTVPVFRPNGSLLGAINVNAVTSNLTFGDADRRTLYITTTTSLYQLRLNVTGHHQ